MRQEPPRLEPSTPPARQLALPLMLDLPPPAPPPAPRVRPREVWAGLGAEGRVAVREAFLRVLREVMRDG